jgi:allantoinase
MRFDLTIHGGTLVGELGICQADLGIRDGRIAAIAARLPEDAGAARLAARGLHVFPGGVDPHVHANDLGWSHRDDFAGVTAAAAAGGITTFLEMPQNEPPTTSPAALRLKQAAVAARARIDCGLWGGLVPGNLDALEPMWGAGVVGFKAFMVTARDIPRVDDPALLAGMRRLAALGGLVGVHCENDALVQEAMSRLRAAGRTDRRAHGESRPALAELEATRRALTLAAAARARLHVCHLSLADLVPDIEAARRAGTDVSVETCPHYLVLTEEDHWRLGPAAKCVPPLRTARDREGLWQALKAGRIDMLASDHAPHPLAEKQRGEAVVWEAPNGIQGIQLMLPVLLSEGVHRRGFPLAQVPAVFSANAARRFGLYPTKGSLRVGADADLALADLDREWEFGEGDILGKHRWSPYVGLKLRGRVEYTLSRGRLVYASGQVVGPPGRGRWIARP